MAEKDLLRIEIKLGVLAGLAMGAYELLEYALGWHNERLELGVYLGGLSFVIPAMLLFVALRKRRSRAGHLSLRNGVRSAFLFSLLMAGVATICMSIYLVVLNPEYPAQRAEFGREQYRERLRSEQPELSEARITRYAREQFPTYPPAQLLTSYGLVRLGYGLLLGLVFSMVLRRDPAPTSSESPESQPQPQTEP